MILYTTTRERLVRRYYRVVGRVLRRDVVVARSEKKFKALLETAPDAIVLVDWHGHIKLVNAQAEQMFGYARRELVGRHIAALLPERERGAHRARFREYVRDARVQPMGGDRELFGMRRDGSEFPIEVSLGPLETDEGLLISSVIRDVTERKRAEAALREAEAEAEAEERFRTIFEQAPVGITLTALDGTLLRVNQAVCDITGYRREELESESFTRLMHVDDRDAALEAWQRLVVDGGRYRAERRYVAADGRIVPVEVSVVLVRDRSGRPLHCLAQVNDITERKRVEEQLQYLADHDALTGLLNRRRFEDELERLVAGGASGAVLAIDLDHFKLVNDTLGHSIGDELIIRVGSLFNNCLKPTDVLARLGGDEFAVILPGAGPDAARQLSQRLLDELGRHASDAHEGSPARWVTASIGIAMLAPGAGDAEETLAHADVAMYDAKEAGRNRIESYDATRDRQGRMQNRLSWAQRIRDALAEDRFVLHAQPILALGPDPTPRHELLIRMRDDDDRPILPAAFLEVAERTELVQQIDRWVLTQTIEILARQKRAGHELVLSINLSAKSVSDPQMTAFVASELANAGIDGCGLCLEVTETAAIGNIERAQRFAHELSELGCEFALDDFGAGFASFYYLKYMHFDYLKIDGEFIRDLPQSRINQLVVRSVADIAQGLGKRTVAEFVGDAETLLLLRGYGIDYAQGFYLAKPGPVDELDFQAIPVARLLEHGG